MLATPKFKNQLLIIKYLQTYFWVLRNTGRGRPEESGSDR
jgi:hypothetical protein